MLQSDLRSDMFRGYFFNAMKSVQLVHDVSRCLTSCWIMKPLCITFKASSHDLQNHMGTDPWLLSELIPHSKLRIERVQANITCSHYVAIAMQHVHRFQIHPIMHNKGTSPTTPPSYIRIRAIWWACGPGQTDAHTHRRVWQQYISRHLRLTWNVIRKTWGCYGLQ